MCERIIDTETLFKGAVFRVLRHWVQLRPGLVVEREVVDKGGDSVAIVAVDEARHIYLINEYCCAIQARALSLPKGMIDAGESPEEAVLRELREETGLSGNLRLLARMSLSPGYLNQQSYVFLATDLKVAPLAGDEEHAITVVRMPIAEAFQKAREGEINDARTIAGISLAQAALEEESANSL